MLLTLVPDLNIAALKYAHITREFGGPIAAVSFRERKSVHGPYFEAFASLDESKTGRRIAGDPLSGGAHGIGLAPTKAEAVHSAISSALELWARNASLENTSLQLTPQPIRDGFAAFPGLGQQGARKRALFEAARHWAIQAWWEGGLPHSSASQPGIEAIQIPLPVPGVAAAIAWREENKLVSYGVGASYSPATATEAAKWDLLRSRDRLELLATSRSMIGLEASPLSEKRMLFFADPEGFACFQERIARQGTRRTAPTLIVDAPVAGEWSQYAHVWRCLFDCSAFRETDKNNYFLF